MVNFKVGGLSQRDRLQAARNQAGTVARVDAAVARYHAETAEPPPPPKIIHHPIDDTLQTGESRKLGGAMEISD